MAVRSPVAIPRERIRELSAREEKQLDERTGGSAALYERARKVLANGVSSSYQIRDPWPIYISHGKGSRVWDVDGREMIDFHNGFGSMVQGHAHDAIVAAIRERAGLGTHFACPNEDDVVVAEELARRFVLPRWRYVNSGSEATMDAIRIARGFTGRDTIMKIHGSYHGHHDYVMVGVAVGDSYDWEGTREELESLPYGKGIPLSVAALTIPVPFNDAGAME
ncbi:MAG: aminotransferase class III-fold pyridoxal phosphate-dependent enzyme, partial [Gaiellaceae bacterium]